MADVEVPEVVGLGVVEALQVLIEAGYQTAHFWAYSTFDDLNVTVRQEPRAGAAVAPPALVTCWIGAGPPDEKDPHKPAMPLRR
ncbi:hypothetical protein [Streptomyces sp. TLI_171]|uniref:hypothetical protein n=1 Tax=Streptomyces sp. TLI_171 TaxID=1938859 RepID=UPI000C1814AE|nr:hypothetical protein [Streptomyces sp. TLI_171]RKE17386.1 hypothetical protein BX266_0642 [Streptomyces sp. TLI_171]